MKKFDVILVGCGRVAVKHAKALRYLQKRKRVGSAALVDLNQKAALRLQKDYLPEAAVYQSLDEIPEDFGDIIVVCTSSGSHYALGKRALSSGRHLLIEKPMCMTVAECDELIAIAAAKGLKIALGHIYRYFPMIKELYTDLEAGRFGKRLYGSVQVRWGHDEAYFNRSKKRGSRKDDGGALMNQSIHAIDLMHMLLGSPELIDCNARLFRLKHDIECEDLAFVRYSFADDRQMLLEGTTLNSEDYHEAAFFLLCEKAEIRASLSKGKIKVSLYREGKELKREYLMKFLRRTRRNYGISSWLQISNPHCFIYLDLLDAIENGGRAFADEKSGRNAVALVEEAYNSSGFYD